MMGGFMCETLKSLLHPTQQRTNAIALDRRMRLRFLGFARNECDHAHPTGGAFIIGHSEIRLAVERSNDPLDWNSRVGSFDMQKRLTVHARHGRIFGRIEDFEEIFRTVIERQTVIAVLFAPEPFRLSDKAVFLPRDLLCPIGKHGGCACLQLRAKRTCRFLVCRGSHVPVPRYCIE